MSTLNPPLGPTSFIHLVLAKISNEQGLPPYSFYRFILKGTVG